MKEIKNKIILVSLLLINACAVSPQLIPKVNEINSKVSSASPKPANPMKSSSPLPEIKTEESISPEKDPELNPQSSVNASSIPTTSPSPTDDRSTSASYTPPSNSEYENGRPTPPPYAIPYYPESKNNPVEEGIRRGFISLIFKDEFKVIYSYKKKEFYSLVGSDLTNINNLVTEYNLPIISSTGSGFSEEELSQIEKESEEFWGVDVENRGSIYDLYTEDDVEINVKELIEKLRLDPLVREANEGLGLGTAD